MTNPLYKTPAYRIASRSTALILVLGFLFTTGGCALFGSNNLIPAGGPAIPSGNKVALASGSHLVAATPAGQISIEAGPGLRRIFGWDGMRRGVITVARTKPFANAAYKGITYDGSPKAWQRAGGITHLRYEEGIRNFETKDDALIWMKIRRLYFTYNNEGLAVGVSQSGNTLHVEVWQFTINGQKPTSMPDAEDSSISLT